MPSPVAAPSEVSDLVYLHQICCLCVAKVCIAQRCIMGQLDAQPGGCSLGGETNGRQHVWFRNGCQHKQFVVLQHALVNFSSAQMNNARALLACECQA